MWLIRFALTSLKKLTVYLVFLGVILMSGSLISELKSPSFSEKTMSSRFMSLAVQKAEYSYHLALLKANDRDMTFPVNMLSFEKVNIVSSTANGTCFNSEGQQTDCEGRPVESSVVLEYGDLRCRVHADQSGMVSSSCTE
jgi:hypothetical protein